MNRATSFDKEDLVIGSYCQVNRDKYQGYGGKVKCYTAWKVVLCLEDWDSRCVMIWQTSVRPCEVGVELVIGSLKKTDNVRIVCGRCENLDGTVVIVHPWMVTVSVPVLARDVQVYQTSVWRIKRTCEGSEAYHDQKCRETLK
jgi:hypothetical protein